MTKQVVRTANDALKRLSLIAPFVLTLTYITITVLTIDHEKILLAREVTLPLLSTEVGLRPFFLVAPFLVFVLHLYILTQHRVLSRYIGVALEESNRTTGWQQLLPSLPLSRITDVEHGGFLGLTIRLVYFMALASPFLVIALIFERLLPAHGLVLREVTHDFWQWTLLILLLADGLLILFFWPPRPKPYGAGPRPVLDWERLPRFRFWIGVALVLLPVIPGLLLLWPTDARCELHPALVTIKRWSPWPINWPEPHLVLPGIDLSGREGVILDGRDLRCADLQGADLGDASMRGVNLQGANLVGSVLSGVDMSPLEPLDPRLNRDVEPPIGIEAPSPELSTDLSHAFLDHAWLEGTFLRKARMVRTSMRNAHLRGADLAGANLTGSDLSGADARAASFRSAVLSEAIFDFAQLDAADFFQAAASGARFLDAEAPFADFRYAEMPAARFVDAALQGATFAGATAVGATFLGGDLGLATGLGGSQMILRHAEVGGAILCGEEPVFGSDLRGVTTREVDWSWLSGRFSSARRRGPGKARLAAAGRRLQALQDNTPQSCLPRVDPQSGVLWEQIDPEDLQASSESRFFREFAGRALENAMNRYFDLERDVARVPAVCSYLEIAAEEAPLDTAWRNALRAQLEERFGPELEVRRPLRRYPRNEDGAAVLRFDDAHGTPFEFHCFRY